MKVESKPPTRFLPAPLHSARALLARVYPALGQESSRTRPPPPRARSPAGVAGHLGANRSPFPRNVPRSHVCRRHLDSRLRLHLDRGADVPAQEARFRRFAAAHGMAIAGQRSRSPTGPAAVSRFDSPGRHTALLWRRELASASRRSMEWRSVRFPATWRTTDCAVAEDGTTRWARISGKSRCASGRQRGSSSSRRSQRPCENRSRHGVVRWRAPCRSCPSSPVRWATNPARRLRDAGRQLVAFCSGMGRPAWTPPSRPSCGGPLAVRICAAVTAKRSVRHYDPRVVCRGRTGVAEGPATLLWQTARHSPACCRLESLVLWIRHGERLTTILAERFELQRRYADAMLDARRLLGGGEAGSQEQQAFEIPTAIRPARLFADPSGAIPPQIAFAARRLATSSTPRAPSSGALSPGLRPGAPFSRSRIIATRSRTVCAPANGEVACGGCRREPACRRGRRRCHSPGDVYTP